MQVIEPISEELIRAQTKMQVEIVRMVAYKLDQRANCSKPVRFNVSVNFEEVERGFDKVALEFVFTVTTDPRVVNYEVKGRTVIEGESEHIERAFDPHPSTKVPMVLYDLYQQVYNLVFVLSRTIDAPCPPHELLFRRPAVSRMML